MANIMDYLAWRGDVEWAYSPANAVDSLILATLSYLDYPDQPVSLSDAAMTLDAPPPREINFVRDARALLSAAGLTPRFAGLTIHSPVSVIDQERDMQFAAVTFDAPDGAHHIAFRGTDNTIVGWREDFNMAFESPIPAQTAAAAYLTAMAERLPGPLVLCGHSKGGNLAVYAASHAPQEVQERIRAIFSFDGPGLDDATMASDGYARIARRIRSYVPRSSVVGMLLTYHPEYTVIKSDSVSLLQHDSFTWQVLGTDFIQAPEVDAGSQLVDQTVHAWLSQVTPEQRRLFISTLFDLLEASGASTMKELLQDVPDRAAAILRALQKVDLETARMIVTLLGRFVSIGAQNVLGLIRQKLNPEPRHDALPPPTPENQDQPVRRHLP